MGKDNLYTPFELVLRESMDVCPRGAHTHTFFEIVYIVDGTGIQRINNIQVAYTPGDLFVLKPNDNHTFEIATTSRFFFIRFNNSFLHMSKQQKELSNRLESILKNAGLEPGCILKKESDKEGVKRIIEILIHEHLNQGIFQKELIEQLINSLLFIVARNVLKSYPLLPEKSADKTTLDILSYIQSNIYFPEKLKIRTMASYFNLSNVYISRYFKRYTGENLQQYILQTKLKLIENRLMNSNMRISEIADEFGFTDKSHLYRFFQKAKGVSPSEYRFSYRSS